MNQSAIACFLSAARTGSFSETAKELYLTRQAVSKNIQELEKEVGYPLFHSRRNPLTLTMAGARLYDYFFSVDFDLSGVRRIFDRSVVAGPHLRLGWGMWVRPGSELLDAVQAFAAKNGVTLGVVQDWETEVLDHLRTGEADVAFLTRYMSSFLKEPYTAIPLEELPLRLAIAKGDNRLEAEDVRRIIRELPYLACMAGEKSEREVIGRVSRELVSFQTMPPRIDILPNVESVMLQVMLGNGFSCSPNAHLYGYGLDTIVLKRTISLCLVWLNRNTNPSILALRDWLKGGGTQ